MHLQIGLKHRWKYESQFWAFANLANEYATRSAELPLVHPADLRQRSFPSVDDLKVYLQLQQKIHLFLVILERPKNENGKTLRDKYGKKVKAQRGARFDLVIFNEKNESIFVIEVKRNEKRTNSKKNHYENIAGVPCYTVGSLEQCLSLIKSLK